MPEFVQRNYEHTWGSYLEWPVGEKLLLRVVRVYGHRGKPNAIGARNSVHSHPTTEWVMGISGTTRCYVGPDLDHLEPTDLRPGHIVEFPAGTAHRIEFVTGENQEDGVPYTELLEIMAGEHHDGTYPITRHEPAMAADYPQVR